MNNANWESMTDTNWESMAIFWSCSISLGILFDYPWQVMNLKSLTLRLDTSARVLG